MEHDVLYYHTTPYITARTTKFKITVNTATSTGHITLVNTHKKNTAAQPHNQTATKSNNQATTQLHNHTTTQPPNRFKHAPGQFTPPTTTTLQQRATLPRQTLWRCWLGID